MPGRCHRARRDESEDDFDGSDEVDEDIDEGANPHVCSLAQHGCLD